MGQSLDVQLEKLKGCDKIFKEKRSGVDTGRPALKQCLEFARTLHLRPVPIISELAENGVSFKVIDDPSIDTASRTGKLVMGILSLIAEFENDIRRERQMDGIKKAQERGVRFGRKPLMQPEDIVQVRELRAAGKTVPDNTLRMLRSRMVKEILPTNPSTHVMASSRCPLSGPVSNLRSGSILAW
jgi:DNA invertase Pin-like site-specific DNA recombinase